MSFGLGPSMDTGPRPMNSTLDVSLLQKLAQKDIVALLQKFQGDKAIVWDRTIANAMNLIVKHSDLKEQGVTRMFSLEQGQFGGDNMPETIVFICRPLMDVMRQLVLRIRQEERARLRRFKYHLFFLPRKSTLCTRFLEEQGVYSSLLSVEEFPVFLFPLDKDVISLEQEYAMRDFKLDLDPTGLYNIAKAVFVLQKTYGVPARVFGLGNAAKQVHELVQSVKQESGPFKPQVSGSNIDCMILIDREVDLLSTMVTQLTYEGLIDEFFGISNNQVKFPEEKFGEAKTMMLSSAENLYVELRDKSFSAVGGVIRSRTVEIQEIFRQKERGEMSIGEMKRLVQQLPAVNALKQSLSDHTSIAELIKSKTETEEFLNSLECEQVLLSGMDTEKVNPHIENMCGKKAPLNAVLRLIIIQCITSGGLKTKIMQHYERLIIQNYGFECLLNNQKLYDLGLFRTQNSGSRYSVLKRTLQLTRNDVPEIKPDDFTYVHSIYAPLSIRLVQHRLRPQLWTNLKDSLQSLLQKEVFDEECEVPVISNVNLSSLKRQPKVTVVVFIGGCTYAEISALRFLAQQDDEREFLVVTSKMINGNTFLNTLLE